MKDLKINIFILFVIIFCLSCVANNPVDECSVIDCESSDKAQFYLTTVCLSIEYVPLETNENCLLSDNVRYKLLNDRIIVTDLKKQNIFLFDRNGAFIRKLGKRGNGPNEYLMVTSMLSKERRAVYVDNIKNWLGIYIDNGKTFVINKPEFKFSDNGLGTEITKYYTSFLYPIYNFIDCDSLLFAGYVDNISGNMNVRFVKFNNDGQVLQFFENNRFYQPLKNTARVYPAVYDKYKDNVLCKEPNNDTVFQLTETNIKPYYVFKLGKKSIPYDRPAISNFDVSKYIDIDGLYELDNFIFFTYWTNRRRYWGYYDKGLDSTYLPEDKIRNDIDDFLPIADLYDKNENQLLSVIQSVDIVKFFRENTDKALNVKVLKLKNVKEDDNPVVVILTLKKER